MKKHDLYKIISAILLFVFLFVALSDALSGTSPFGLDIENMMLTGSFPFAYIARQMTGDSLTNTVQLRIIDERFGNSLINWQIFGVWLLSQISMIAFYAFLYKYLLACLGIVLFFHIIILWKQSKDGNKRPHPCYIQIKYRGSRYE